MIRIICGKCKNAYLQKEGTELSCPNCKAVYPEAEENFLLGAQYYNESKLSEANDCLMKYIVKNGAEPRAIFYKALCDGFDYDEDTTSLADVYSKLIQSLSELPDDLFIQYLAKANDETEKLEKLIAEMHIRLFEDADAEKIKKEVTSIIKLKDEAVAFRSELTKLAEAYNERATDKISVSFSKCALVKPEIAAEVGELRFNKIVENIASHTVFTGILSTDIKNLEIYYRCIVMFFETNRQKYDFLLSTAGKFEQLDKLLAEGSYTAIKGVGTIANKIKNAAYDFFQDSLKDHDDEFEQQTETVVVIATEIVEEEIPAQDEEAEETEESEDITEFEDVYSSSDVEEKSGDEETTEPEAVEDEAPSEEATEEVIEDTIVEIDEILTNEATEEATDDTENEEAIVETDEAPVEAEESTEETEEPVDDAEIIEISTENIGTAQAEETPAEESNEESSVNVLEAIAQNGTIADDTEEAEELPAPDAEEAPASEKKIKHKKNYAPFVAVLLVILAVIGLIALKVVPAKLNEKNYAQAQALEAEKNYGEAASVYAELGDYEDSVEKAKLCKYNNALVLEKAGKFAEAKTVFEALGDYKDSAAKVTSCTYNEALAVLDSGKYDDAAKIFEALGDYLDSKTKIAECTYKKALDYTTAKDYEGAIELLKTIPDYAGSEDALLNAKYGYVNANLDAENETTLIYLKDLAKAKYKDSIDIKNKLLGTTEDLSKGVTLCINYDANDKSTNLTEVEHTKRFYFHVTVNDETLYNKKLTIDYITSVGYHDTKDIVLTADDNTYALDYPSTANANYSIDFKLLGNDNSTIATQSVTVK